MNYYHCCWIHAASYHGCAVIGGTKIFGTDMPEFDIGRAHQVISKEEANNRPVIIVSWQRITLFQAEQYLSYARGVLKDAVVKVPPKGPAKILQLLPKPPAPDTPQGA